jgi:ABC-type spermidine/putrescine transport system permease subunit I
MMQRLPRLALGVPAVLLLLVFLILPYAEMITMSFRTSQPGTMYGLGYTADNYRKVATDTLYLDALARSLLTAAAITFACLVISYPIAWHMSRARGRKALLLYACVASPLMIGVLIRNFGWMIVVNVDGPLNRALLSVGVIDRPMRLLFTQGLVALALVHVFTPFMVLPINNALRNINPAILEASRSLGAGRIATFWKVILPLSFPGMQPGLILVFVLATAAYVTPALLGGQMVSLMPTLVVQTLVGTFDWPLGAALAVMMATAAMVVVILFSLATHRLMERVRA